MEIDLLSQINLISAPESPAWTHVRTAAQVGWLAFAYGCGLIPAYYILRPRKWLFVGFIVVTLMAMIWAYDYDQFFFGAHWWGIFAWAWFFSGVGLLLGKYVSEKPVH